MKEQHDRELTQTQVELQKYMADHEAKLTELELKYRTNVPGSLV